MECLYRLASFCYLALLATMTLLIGVAASAQPSPQSPSNIPCDGAPTHRHPNGGGIVANTAVVDPQAFVGPDAWVCDDAHIFKGSQINGRSRLRKSGSIILNSVILGNQDRKSILVNKLELISDLGVEMLAEPNVSSSVIKKLRYGTRVYVQSNQKDSDWIEVALSYRGAKGWIKKNQASEIKQTKNFSEAMEQSRSLLKSHDYSVAIEWAEKAQDMASKEDILEFESFDYRTPQNWLESLELLRNLFLLTGRSDLAAKTRDKISLDINLNSQVFLEHCDTRFVDGAGIRLRELPNQLSKSVDILKYQSQVCVIGSDAGWSEVFVAYYPGLVGWIADNLLTKAVPILDVPQMLEKAQAALGLADFASALLWAERAYDLDKGSSTLATLESIFKATDQAEKLQSVRKELKNAQKAKAQAEEQPSIFEPGIYYETPVVTGLKYFCYTENMGFRQMPIKVEKTEKGLIAEGVEVQTPIKASFCVSGLKKLKKGTLATYDFKPLLKEITVTNADFIRGGVKKKVSRKIKIGNDEYFLIAENVQPSDMSVGSIGKPNSNYTKEELDRLFPFSKQGVLRYYWGDSPADFQVYLSNGKARFLLGQFSSTGPTCEKDTQGTLEILWSGDLDGDGLPDFFVSNGGLGELFITTSTEPKGLLRKFASLNYSCGD